MKVEKKIRLFQFADTIYVILMMFYLIIAGIMLKEYFTTKEGWNLLFYLIYVILGYVFYLISLDIKKKIETKKKELKS